MNRDVRHLPAGTDILGDGVTVPLFTIEPDTARAYPWARDFLTVFAHTGNNTAACELAGISYSTYRTAVKRDEHFSELYEICREISIDKLEARARERAEKDSDRLMELLLKALRPEKYRERYEVTQRTVTDFIIDITPQHTNAGIDANQSDKPPVSILE